MKSNTTAKMIVVPENGQISIGKKWAGRKVLLEEIGEGELLVSAGQFVPDRQAAFFTAEAKQSLSEFNAWAAETPPKQTDLRALKARLLAQRKASAKR